MKQISIEELHQRTEHWVKEAVGNAGILITENGKPVATISQVLTERKGKTLPDRTEEIKRMPFISVDSGVYISEDRDRA